MLKQCLLQRISTLKGERERSSLRPAPIFVCNNARQPFFVFPLNNVFVRLFFTQALSCISTTHNPSFCIKVADRLTQLLILSEQKPNHVSGSKQRAPHSRSERVWYHFAVITTKEGQIQAAFWKVLAIFSLNRFLIGSFLVHQRNNKSYERTKAEIKNLFRGNIWLLCQILFFFQSYRKNTEKICSIFYFIYVFAMHAHILVDSEAIISIWIV